MRHILKALSIRSKDRYQSVQDMIDALMKDFNQRKEVDKKSDISEERIEQKDEDGSEIKIDGFLEIVIGVILMLVMIFAGIVYQE